MKAVGLYDPAYEHDSCGVAFVARLDGVASHETLVRALRRRSEPRAPRRRRAPTPLTGDGAGMTLQLPDALFRAEVGAALPPLGALRRRGVLPAARRRAAASLERSSAETVEAEGQTVVALARRAGRPAPRGRVRRRDRAAHPAALRRRSAGARATDDFERKLYVIRRVAELAAGPELVIPSFSSRTVVYKGMLTAPQLDRLLPGPARRAHRSALALVHSRYSTNTFPSWELAHPYRMIAHNGEINTLRGNVNWMRRASRSWRPSSSATTSRRCCRSSGPAAPTRRRSTTCSSCSCSRAGRCRTR